MDRFRRASAAVLLTAAVMAGAVGAASASSDVPAVPSAAGPQAAPAPPTLSAHTSVENVGAWQQFRIHGSARHMPSGTEVTLQQKQGNRWVSLPATMRTSGSDEYSMRVMLGARGDNALRIVGGGAVSPVVRTTVR